MSILRSRIVQRRRAARSRQELDRALSGAHGPGVQADVVAALRRR